LKENKEKNYKVTLISEKEYSFYSGMLPGAIAGLYTDEELKVNLETAAIWC
jgi:NADH dehydrogenase FAD-containing subunit